MAENIAAMLIDFVIGAPESVAIGMVLGFIFAKILNRRRGFGGSF